MNNEQTISRIRKLLALANNNENEHEAAVALERAQMLMQNANLSFATIEAAGQSAEGGTRVKDGVESRSPYKWHRSLMSAIADLNSVSCGILFSRGRGTRSFRGYSLIGREANIASTRVMHEYLIQAVERVLRDHVGNDPAFYFTRYAHEFKEGAATRVIERLRERHEKNVAEQERQAREANARAKHPASTGGALVVVMRDYYREEQELNNDLKLGWPLGTTTQKRLDCEASEAATRARISDYVAKIKAENPDLDEEVLWYLDIGYSLERALEIHRDHLEREAKQKPKTDAQRRKREEQERAARERYYQRQARNAKGQGYYAGIAKGDEIGLDQQAEYEAKRRLA